MDGDPSERKEKMWWSSTVMASYEASQKPAKSTLSVFAIRTKRLTVVNNISMILSLFFPRRQEKIRFDCFHRQITALLGARRVCTEWLDIQTQMFARHIEDILRCWEHSWYKASRQSERACHSFPISPHKMKALIALGSLLAFAAAQFEPHADCSVVW